MLLAAVCMLTVPWAAGSVSRSVAAQQPPSSREVGRVAVDSSPIRLDAGRFTMIAYPQDLVLARALLQAAVSDDSFPGLPRPVLPVVVAIAPDVRRFREWVGPAAPEWGAAVAIPARQRVVMRGRGAGATAGGEPRTVLRHELAHLALHEMLAGLPPRWFDEGYASYAAREWGREELLATNRALLLRRFPSLRELDAQLVAGPVRASGAYALSYRAVAELAALDPERGLTLFFRYWKEGGRLDSAIRRAYGITLDGFEERWQQRTRRSFGVLALVGDLTIASLLLILILIPFVLARRRRDGARMDALRRQDLLLDARAAAAGTTVEVLLGIADAVEGSGAAEDQSEGQLERTAEGPGEGPTGGRASTAREAGDRGGPEEAGQSLANGPAR